MRARGHVNNISTMQSSGNTPSESYMLSLTECVWDFQNNALWDTHQHALLIVCYGSIGKKSLLNLRSFESL